MASTANIIDLSELSTSSRREVHDFYQFILARCRRVKKAPSANAEGCSFYDLCGGLSWKGDAVATQRDLRDEYKTP